MQTESVILTARSAPLDDRPVPTSSSSSGFVYVILPGWEPLLICHARSAVFIRRRCRHALDLRLARVTAIGPVFSDRAPADRCTLREWLTQLDGRWPWYADVLAVFDDASTVVAKEVPCPA